MMMLIYLGVVTDSMPHFNELKHDSANPTILRTPIIGNYFRHMTQLPG